MSTGWVAGTVRATALARRRLGSVAIERLSAAGGLTPAVDALARSPYGHDVRPGMDLAQAERAIAATLLWNLRVLAGWLPTGGVRALRALAAWGEIANTDDLMRALVDGAPQPPPLRLGSLSTAWPRLAVAGSLMELRAALTASGWGDPGGESPYAVALTMRVSWANRLADVAPMTRDLAVGALALLVARERFGPRGRWPASLITPTSRLLGTGWYRTATLAEFRAALGPSAAWVLAGVEDLDGLWRAEIDWWRRVHRDGLDLLRQSSYGVHRVIGAALLLAADAWRSRAALAIANGSRPGEVDVLA